MFLAFMMMLCYSSSIVTIRSQLGLGGICKYRRCVRLECVYFSVGGRAPFVGNFAITHHDLIICPVLGVVKIGFGTVLMTVSAQHVPAAQVPLKCLSLALLDVIFGPIWVWIGVGEEPSLYTLVGGAIVLAGVIIQVLATTRLSDSVSVFQAVKQIPISPNVSKVGVCHRDWHRWFSIACNIQLLVSHFHDLSQIVYNHQRGFQPE